MFTDGEVLLSMSHARAMKSTVNDAQALINRKNAALKEAYDEIVLLRAALVNSQDQLRQERAGRIAIEVELDDLRRLVDEAL